MYPRILVALFGLAVLVGCDDSSTSDTPEPTPKSWSTGGGVEVPMIDTGTYSSSFLEDNGDFTYREQITFGADGSFEFVDYETDKTSGKITSYTKFLGQWRQADSSILLTRKRRIYHTTFPDESNTDEALDPTIPQVFGTGLRIASRTSFSLLMPDGSRVDFTKAAKIQFAFRSGFPFGPAMDP